MNILITTLSMLLVLSISAGFFWREVRDSTESLLTAKGFFGAARIAQNKYEIKQFQRLPKFQVENPPKEKKTPTQKDKVFVSHRLVTPPLEQGHLHIASLWQLEHTPVVQPLIKKLFKELYGHVSWYEEKGIDRLIAALSKPREKFDIQEFSKSLDPELYSLWYRMMKGTQVYNTEEQIGYPPLTDFVDFSFASAKNLCHFRFAPLPVLRAFFGKELTNQILKMENEKWQEGHRYRFCTKKEFLTIISKTGRAPELTNIVDTFCYFKQSVGKRSFVQGTEQKRGIALRKTIINGEQAPK